MGFQFKPIPQDAITDFHDENYWLDNMFICPIFWQPGLEFNAVEQGFVYFKTINSHCRAEILKIDDPYECKAYGREMPMRSDWDQIKFGIMYELVRKKFDQNRDLRRKLITTGGRFLLEGNTWHDDIWGHCWCTQCSGVLGANFLGKTLMSVRAQYHDRS